jgi:two-component system CheB/CheR fusion protein
MAQKISKRPAAATKRAARTQERHGTSPPAVVGIGASAGGIAALQALFRHVPDKMGVAYVVILHLAPDIRSELAAVLAPHSKMPVNTVSEPMLMEPDNIYVIPPDRRLELTDGIIAAVPFDEPRARRSAVDSFFMSLARQHADGFAVVLSGAGSDGSLGVKAIKEAGGIILVQDPAEAEYPSMPRSAVATGVADFVLPVRKLAERLTELIRNRERSPAPEPRQDDDEQIRRILAHLRVRTGHDFSRYKGSTVLRRIQRRVQVARKESFADYYAYLRENAEEAQALFSDLLISVTMFFRDPDAFDTLAAKAISQIFDGRTAVDQIRVWAPGCATGEEAYTLGMMLLEEASRRELRPEIQVFGSDLDANALNVAREGRYPLAIEQDVSEERLRRFFTRESDHYRVKRELRDIVLFAGHSLLRDPPFSRIDLISCRNLLIYLDRELQNQVIGVFHYALKPNGFLFLGSSESADHPGQLFRVVDREAHLYQSVAGRSERLPILPRMLEPVKEPAPAKPAPATSTSEAGLHREALEWAAPPSILVDLSHRAVHLSETAGRYLMLSAGPVSADVVELVRPELRLDLRAALHRAFERGEPSLSLPTPVRFNGTSHRVQVLVKPASQSDERGPARALVMFVEGDAIEESGDAMVVAEAARGKDDAVRRLAEELRLTQGRLRATREESEGVNEELRAANEELQSINEEYRSTSEELETSKEELQSINEELQTVNNELKLKLEGVSRANSDLQNLMDATDVGTLFLDPALRIKRFTPRLTDLFNITVNDHGRPITDFTHQLEYPDLAKDALAVLRNLVPVQREVRSSEDVWFLTRVRPYRTVDDRIDGVVMTFIDITERRRMESALRESEERLRREMKLVESSRWPIFVWDMDGGVIQWNRGSERLYGYSDREALGKRVDELLKTKVLGSGFEGVLKELATSGAWFGELEQLTRDGRRIIVESAMEFAPLDGRRLVLESTRDVTDRKLWEQRKELMLSELSHRVKNTLAVVQSFASQSIRGADSAETFTERFDGRLLALAKTHQLLVDPWKGAEVESLARDQLAPYAKGDPDRVRLEGPAVSLPADLAVPLGLVLHELATNAVKHGALSKDTGKVVFSWRLSSGSGPPGLDMEWRESGGPPVEPEPAKGFGSRLIERGLANAKVTRAFNPEGLICRIELPLPEGAHGME